MSAAAVKLASFLVRMYLATGIDTCQLMRVATQDFDASGSCYFDPDSEDSECTEIADFVLTALFNECEIERGRFEASE